MDGLSSALFAYQSELTHPTPLAAILFSLITYFAVGLSIHDGGASFFTFALMLFMFSVCVGQVFRLIACLTPRATTAQPMCGVYMVIMVLFSGYIIPYNGISDGWVWYYWINPLAYALKAVTINEFLGEDYDELICSNYPTCTQHARYGDIILEGRGEKKHVTSQASTAICLPILSPMALINLINTPIYFHAMQATPPSACTCGTQCCFCSEGTSFCWASPRWP